jgi:uncharacterized iron-regulated membrane protein
LFRWWGAGGGLLVLLLISGLLIHWSRYRTVNRQAVAGSDEDWTKFNP